MLDIRAGENLKWNRYLLENLLVIGIGYQMIFFGIFHIFFGVTRPEFSFQRYNTSIHFSNLPAGLIASGMSGRHSNDPYQCLSI
jgi:hypothetical protein